MSEGVLNVVQVEKSFDGVRALKGLSLRLEPGQIGCLLGPSGCGKTTLLRAIAGFEAIDAGTISLSGLEVSSVTKHMPAHQRGLGSFFRIMRCCHIFRLRKILA